MKLLISTETYYKKNAYPDILPLPVTATPFFSLSSLQIAYIHIISYANNQPS